MLINNNNNKSTEPSYNLEIDEFNHTIIQLGSLISILYNKRLNYIALLSIIMKNDNIKRLYMEMTGITNIYTIIQLFIQNTPNLHKKIAKRSLFQ